jgi:hypothetical protein
MPATLNQDQIERRKPIWLTLSELWLDTELQDEDLERIARTMTDSGLPLDELRDIYLIEVAPVVYTNLLQVAGEWAGFDEEELYGRIVENLTHHRRRAQFQAWFPLTRWPMI